MVCFRPAACDQAAVGSRVGRGRAAAAGGRAVRIGNDLAKIDVLLKNVVLGQFVPSSDLLDLKNGSDSKFRL